MLRGLSMSRAEVDSGHDWLDELAGTGVTVLHGHFSPEAVAALAREIGERDAGCGLLPAAVGRGEERRVLDSVRGDRIRWLDGSTPAQRDFLDRMEAIRQPVNRALMLGLFEVEAHFAVYPPGAGYERHRDAFRADNPRRLSAVLYLNRDWEPADGGALAIYDAHGREVRRIWPEAGTLVLFLSQDVPHAVLPTRRRRASIAAWFRVRDSRSPSA